MTARAFHLVRYLIRYLMSKDIIPNFSVSLDYPIHFYRYGRCCEIRLRSSITMPIPRNFTCYLLLKQSEIKIIAKIKTDDYQIINYIVKL